VARTIPRYVAGQLLEFVVVGGGDRPGFEFWRARLAELSQSTLARRTSARSNPRADAHSSRLEGPGRDFLPAYPADLFAGQRPKATRGARGAPAPGGPPGPSGSTPTVVNARKRQVHRGGDRHLGRRRESPRISGRLLPGRARFRWVGVIVGPDLSIPGHPEVFVVGGPSPTSSRTGTALPGFLAPGGPCSRGERWPRSIEQIGGPGRPRKAFFGYRDKGDAGDHRSLAGQVGVIGGLRFKRPSWLGSFWALRPHFLSRRFPQSRGRFCSSGMWNYVDLQARARVSSLDCTRRAASHPIPPALRSVTARCEPGGKRLRPRASDRGGPNAARAVVGHPHVPLYVTKGVPPRRRAMVLCSAAT